MLNARFSLWFVCAPLCVAAVFLSGACTVTFQIGDPPTVDDDGGEGAGEGEGEGEGDPDVGLRADGACDFGYVAVGEEASCSVSISNAGSREIAIDNLALEGDPAFGSGSVVPVTYLPPGASLGITLVVRPVGAGLVTGMLVVGSRYVPLDTARIPLRAVGVSGTSLVVEATWADAAADVDLHLTQLNADNTACVQALPDGTALPGAVARACDGTQDCSWQTCMNVDTTTVEWDGVAGHSAGDPVLDLDDVDGLGPEVASVAALGAGRSLVSLVGFTAQSSTQATVRLYADGFITAEFVVPVNGLALTEVAVVVQRASGAVCIEDLTDGDGSDDCGT